MNVLETHITDYDYYAVVDFEATCEDSCKGWKNEIIEFPTVIINAKTLEVVAEFQKYVKPILNPKLTTFCTALTGITQEVVDAGLDFEDVLKSWYLFMKDFPNHLLICCGDWDFKTMLPNQYELTYGVMFIKRCFTDDTFSEITTDELFYSRLVSSLESSRHDAKSIPLPNKLPIMVPKWCNVKICFNKALPGCRARGMPSMLDQLGLTLEGRHHSGIDDCRNIANIVITLVKRFTNAAIFSTSRFCLTRNQMHAILKK